jgi:hypothetical protein
MELSLQGGLPLPRFHAVGQRNIHADGELSAVRVRTGDATRDRVITARG